METEELTAKKVKQLSKQPIIESFVSTSEDGRWVVHRTVITDIKSRAYFDKVLSDEEGSEDSSGFRFVQVEGRKDSLAEYAEENLQTDVDWLTAQGVDESEAEPFILHLLSSKRSGALEDGQR